MQVKNIMLLARLKFLEKIHQGGKSCHNSYKNLAGNHQNSSCQNVINHDQPQVPELPLLMIFVEVLPDPDKSLRGLFDASRAAASKHTRTLTAMRSTGRQEKQQQLNN